MLAINPGSSSVKAAVRDRTDGPVLLRVALDALDSAAGTLTVNGQDPVPFAGGMAEAVAAIRQALRQRGIVPDAVAHRVVHGGPDHHGPALIEEGLLTELRALIPLAALHLPGALAVIEQSRQAWPGVPQVACFDTAFHAALPPAELRLPVAAELAAAGIRRYGFHGLSVQSVLRAEPELGDAVIAHLGSGCSVTAVSADGLPQHTTMSFTPTAGMVSATRSGDLDPEIVLYLIEQHGYPTAVLRRLFDGGSGLAGIADGRRDLRELTDAGDPHARLAVEVFVRSAAAAIAGAATALTDWRSLVFTGGIGEHNPTVRDRICQRLRLAGVRVSVVPADEERIMDLQARTVLGEPAG
ncbi:MAG TPA: hypothetical protein VFD94_07865 [Jatrophihabitans sp.]|nr:hypothetical protein [Jatrophihabitans sp.]